MMNTATIFQRKMVWENTVAQRVDITKITGFIVVAAMRFFSVKFDSEFMNEWCFAFWRTSWHAVCIALEVHA